MGLFLAIYGVACVAMCPNPSLAETDEVSIDPSTCEGWSLSEAKTTIENNQGWWSWVFQRMHSLLEDVTDFRLYFLPDEVRDFFDDVEVAGYDQL